jgi:hypothetical protein
MFASPYFQALHVRISRLIVPWDVIRHHSDLTSADLWLRAARQLHVEPLVTFNYARGCYDAHGHVPHVAKCRLPSVARYRQAFLAFRSRHPEVHVYSPWNEINHRSQPTFRDPRRAAEFYNVVRDHCPGCTIVAADVLDQKGFVAYLRQFRRYAKGDPRIWGLHNYLDSNNYTETGTKAMLAAVPGEVWLTETGGIVKFKHRPYNPARAAKATRFVFRLARLSGRITRVYIYQWTGSPRRVRFDAGLTGPNGIPRPAYYVVKDHIPPMSIDEGATGASGASGASGPTKPSASNGGGKGSPPSGCLLPPPVPCP